MGFFSDLFGKAQGQPNNQRKDYEPIQMAHKAGTLYYLRARNIHSGFEDILCFNDDINRRRYIATARESTPRPKDWYFDEWEISAEARLQEELEKQRIAITKSYEREINNLKYKIHGLQTDVRSLQGNPKTVPGGSTKLLRQVSDLKLALQQEQDKNRKLQAEYDKIQLCNTQQNNSTNEDLQENYRLLLDEYEGLQEKYSWLLNQIENKINEQHEQKLQEPVIMEQQELDFHNKKEHRIAEQNIPDEYDESIYRLTAYNSVEIMEINDTNNTIRFRWINDGQPERTHRAKIRYKNGEKVFKSYHLTIPLNKNMQTSQTPSLPPITKISNKMNLQELNKLCYTVLTSQDSNIYASIAHDFEQELKSVDAHAPMQGRLVLAIIQRYINENK